MYEDLAPFAGFHDFCNQLATTYLQTYQSPGLAVGAIFGEQVIWRAGYGTLRAGTEDKVTSQTLFHMASVTKPVVATAVMQLVERGAINLDEHFVRYVPEFNIADPRGGAITVRQLLTHTSGLPDVESYGWDRPEFDEGALGRYLESLSSIHLLAAPGARFAYSDIGFNILGALLSRVSGEPFEDLLAKQILQPLGMNASSLLLRRIDRARLAHPHGLDSRGLVYPLPVFPYNRCHAGSSTLYSNVDDMLRWIAVNLGHGTLEGTRILLPATLETMWHGTVGNVHPAIPHNGQVGVSWFVFHRQGRPYIGHMGQDDGFASLLLLVPQERIGVVSMANRSYDYAQQGLWALQFQLIDRLLSDGSGRP